MTWILPKLNPCRCGQPDCLFWRGGSRENSIHITCMCCGRAAEPAMTTFRAYENWNDGKIGEPA